ncbi:MAG: polysaccharide biosynthesis/export family protein [Bacteroidetes bacterium]|nr:polysaccharide biosynthesis/export family protein [Bacteroidota bacterium]MBS1642974.1 polysaccharide biosynthesis/export family protein [Bacteroidota bacterium]MBS1671093.1 polysaccharide biosynthesis/export family protein [Bacteroidota bacterium]
MQILIKRNSVITVQLYLFIVILISSCASTKNFTYFNDLPSTGPTIQLDTLQMKTYAIQKDDIIEMKIAGKSDATANDFNLKSGGFALGQGAIPQYLVDANGEINVYLIGKIKVEGLTIDQVADKVTKLLTPYLIEPIVNLRILNFRFTVLGEVKAPGTFAVANEKISVLQAIGYAGDMNYFSNRKNVKIIRDSSGIRQVGFLDFSSKNVLNSPFYYLQRNDVLYVETNTRYRQTGDAYNRAGLLVGILSSGIAALAILIRR